MNSYLIGWKRSSLSEANSNKTIIYHKGGVGIVGDEGAEGGKKTMSLKYH